MFFEKFPKQEAEQRRQIDESRSKEDEDYKDLAPLMEERTALFQTISEAREKKGTMRTEFKKRENDHYQVIDRWMDMKTALVFFFWVFFSGTSQ